MTLDPVERLNYYQFQYVGAEDLRAQQAYHRDALRRHDLGPHSWGIVSGLRLTEMAREGDPGFVDLYVLPGMAVDGFGRQIMVLEPAKVDGELFAAFDTDRHLELWLRYDEAPAGTATGGFAPCTDAAAYSRVVESYRFLVGTLNPERDAIMVGGDEAKTAALAGPDDPIEPADGSVAYQDFPDDDRKPLWAVRLGSVHWDGTVGKFRPVADPIRLVEGRFYAGFVGGSLLADGPALRFGPRVAAADADAADFASVEGRLRVDGRIVARKDILLHGGKVSWQSTGGSDETVPLWMQRLPKSSGSGADLRIHIGDAESADNRLTIGPGPLPTTLGTEKVVLAVRGDDRIDVPSGRLRFRGDSRQLIDLNVELDNKTGLSGIGRHDGGVYYRSAGDHYWYQQGEHANKDGDPGGGVKLMHLGEGGLHFAEPFRQFLNANVNGQKAGIGSQEMTLYFRSPGHFAWYRGGGPSSGELNPGGGAEAMRLDSAGRLTVDGGITSQGSLQLWGSAIDFRAVSGVTDTDLLQILRFQRGADSNDLRVIIGDNITGDDRFTVGPVFVGDGQYKEQFVVENNGDVRIAGNLYVGTQKALVDVLVGEVFLNRQSAGAGTQTVTLTSIALPSVSSATVTAALSDIGNISVATNARWSVVAGSVTMLPPKSIKFDVNWIVDDIDGELFRFIYVAVLRP
jgi:hypothetical protein